MIPKFKLFLKNELGKIFYGVLISAIMVLVIGVIRIFSTGTFLFLQIIFVSMLLLVLLYLVPHSKFSAKWIKGTEIYLVVFAFTMTSFLLLNIDRSRSVYLLKWVDSARPTGLTFEQIENKGALAELGKTSLRQRIEEQVQSRTFYVDSSERVHTTGSGHLLNQFFSVLARALSLNGYIKS